MSRPALSLLLLAALAVVIGVAARILFGSQPDGDRESPGTARESPAGPTEATDALPPDAASGDALTRSDRDAPAPESSDPESLPPSDHPDAVTVRVVDARTRDPVPGAEVLLLPHARDTGGQRLEYQGPGYQVEEVFDGHGDRYRTGAGGTVRVPPVEETTRVVARKADAIAFANWFSSDEERSRVLALRPRVDVAVRVQHPDGAPVADVPVVYREFVDGSYRHTQRQEYTDAEGRARFPNLQRDVAWMHRQAAGESRLVVSVPLPEPVHAVIDVEDPPEDEIVLTVPPLGRARVQVLDWKGRTLADGRRVVLQAAPEAPEEEQEFHRSEDRWTDTRRIRDGAAEFPVGLGLALQAGARPEGGSEYQSTVFRGPTTPGELVLATLRFDEPPSRLVMRLLAPQGEPLANAWVFLKLDRLKEASGFPPTGEEVDSGFTSQTRTDGGGYVRESARPEDRMALDWHSCVISHLPESVPELWVHGIDLTVHGGLPAGDTDLGDLQLGGSPVLAAGRVAAADGTPLPGARITVFWRPEGMPEVRNQINGRKLVTGKGGAFSISGPLPARLLELTVEHDEHLPHRLEVHPGTQDLEILLDAAAAVSGRVLLDPEIPPRSVVLQLERRRQDADRPWDASKEWLRESDHAFSFAPLEPGEYRVRLTSAASGEELFRLDGLRLAPGRSLAPPRLDPVDLRGDLRVHRLHAVAADGEEIGWIRILPETGRGGDWGGPNPAQFVTVADPLHVRVDAEGYRGRELTLAEREHEIELRRGIEVTFRLDLDAELMRRHELSLEAECRDAGLERSHDATFGPQGGATVVFSWPGEHRLELHGRRTGKRDDGSTYDVSFSLPMGSFEITEASAGAEIVVPVDAAALAHDD